MVVLTLSACTRGTEEPAAGPTSATPSTPAVEPVEGQADVVVTVADSGPIVFHDRPAPEPDQAAIDAFTDAARQWLDDHLTALQDGEDGGRLDEVAAEGVMDAASPDLVDAVTTDLASPDTPVEQASYHLVVAHSGAPLWLRAHVSVVDRDGTGHIVGFVFTPAESNGASLIAFGPGPL